MSASTTWVESQPPVRRRRATDRLVDQPGVRFGIAQGALVLVTSVLAATGVRAAPALALLVLAVVGVGAGLRPGWTVGLGLSAWAYYTGFVEHAEGSLGFASGDLLRLATLAAAGLVVGLGTSRRHGGVR